MNQIWKLARREFRSYFDQPTAYILVVAFLALSLFLTFRSLFASNAATLRPFFDLLPWLLAVFVPAITMRSLAEERRSGTLEWLMSQPVREVDLAVGKFLGDWLFVLVALAGTLPLAFGLLVLTDADPGIMLAQYIGAALLAGLFTAVGLFASSATRNQITAFILAVAISFVLVLAGLQFTLIGLPPAVAGVVSSLAVVPHFDSIARGVIDLRDVLYFVLTAALFLGLAYFLLARERLSPARGAYRRLRVGIMAVAGSVVVLNLLGGHIHGRIDLTRENVYTLADGTREVVGDLDDLVTVKLFVSGELPPEIQLTLRDVRDLLADYRRVSNGDLRVVEANPDDDEDAAEEARSLGIQPIQFNVLRDDELQVRRGWFGLAILYAGESKVMPVIDQTDDLEYRLTSYIAALTAASQPRAAFALGFGAGEGMQYRALRDALGDRYAFDNVNLGADTVPELSPDSFDVLVLAAPTQPMSEDALAEIRAYLDAGGSAFFLVERTRVDPRMPVSQPVNSGLEQLVAEYGVRVASEIAYDMQSNERVSLGQRGVFSYVTAYPLWPVALPAGRHATTRGLDALSLGWASPLEIRDSTRVVPLWTTTEYGGRRATGGPISPEMSLDPDPSQLSPQVLAAAVVAQGAGADADAGSAEGAGEVSGAGESAGSGESERAGDAEGDAGADAPTRAADASRGRLIVVGDGDFLSQNFARGNPQNVAFAANAVDWLAQDEALIGIRAKDRTPPRLRLEGTIQQAGLKWGNLIGIPLLFIVLGAVRVVRRRRRRTITWGEEFGA